MILSGPCWRRAGSLSLAAARVGRRGFAVERDVEKTKTRKQFCALLRRVADAIEKDEKWAVQVDNLRLNVPPTADLSVEHESKDGHHELEFQLKWHDATTPK